jgi:hypothetical protein
VKRSPLARKTPLRPKAKRHKPGAKCHMAKVAQLPCIICASWPVQVHHCIHDRYGTRKASDFDTIPLCPPCHRKLHSDKTAWREAHGPDYGFLEVVRALVAGL